MLKGRCPKCGKEYWGVALAQPEQQICDVCGSKLLVYDESLENSAEGWDKITQGLSQLLHADDDQKQKGS